MLGRIIEIENNNLYLFVQDGFLVIKEDQNLIGKVPLDDIAALILSGPRITISNYLINRLTDHHAIILLTDNYYAPANIIWPLNAYHKIGIRLKLQMNIKPVLKKQLWKHIIFEKLMNQKKVLEYIYNNDFKFQKIIEGLKSGDVTNREAVGSKKYWPILFGKNFKRSDQSNSINSYLNYAYTILRSMIARAVASSGLNPAFGIYHKNEFNAFCLVDDLMEPYRPFIDYYIYHLNKKKELKELNPTIKKQIVAYLYNDFSYKNQLSPLPNCTFKTVFSYIKSLESNHVELEFAKLTNQPMKF